MNEQSNLNHTLTSLRAAYERLIAKQLSAHRVQGNRR